MQFTAGTYKIVLPLVAICGILLFYFTPFRHDGGTVLVGKGPMKTSRPSATLANFHLIIPASQPDVNLCKVMLSAAVAGYPSPSIINWNQTFDSAKFVAGGSHLAKISGIHDYLAALDESQDDDLVLMVDGYDIWLQLRPQTLVDRYFDINRRADARIATELGAAATKHSVRQEIIFGCQKRCWPWKKTDPPCYAVPHSSLPEDVYGPDTDTDIGDEANPYIKLRPRSLNSGVAMGTARAMRRLFQRALVLLEIEDNFGSDQYIFSHILGDQEVWREVLRRESTGSWSSKGQVSKIEFNEEHLVEVRAKAAETQDNSMEFGIGLDYGSEIGLNTVFAEDDTAWLHWSSESQLREAESALGIDIQHSHMSVDGLAPDITDTALPFWTFNREKGLPRRTPWENVSLFTDVWTGIVPAVIHHNAHRDGRKALRETWWDKIWFYGYARTLYDASVYEPIIPVAVSEDEEHGLRQYWPWIRWKGGGQVGQLHHDPSKDEWTRFDDMCVDYHEEVFRDGLGPWKLPAIH